MMLRALARSLILAAVALGAAGTPTSAEQIVVSISRHQVLVNSSFTGTSIVLFGVIMPDDLEFPQRPAPYDVSITIQGPRETVVTRQKERILGIWVNARSRTFVGVPSYFAALSNRPFAEIAPPETLRQIGAGFDNLQLPQRVRGTELADTPRGDPFRTNFIRLKEEHGLYTEQTNAVTMLTPTVFRAGIPVSALAQIGSYEVSVHVLSGGKVVASTQTAFELVKVGFEQFIAEAAQHHGVLYGLAMVIMALATGWFASVVFRRD